MCGLLCAATLPLSAALTVDMALKPGVMIVTGTSDGGKSLSEAAFAGCLDMGCLWRGEALLAGGMVGIAYGNVTLESTKQEAGKTTRSTLETGFNWGLHGLIGGHIGAWDMYVKLGASELFVTSMLKVEAAGITARDEEEEKLWGFSFGGSIVYQTMNSLFVGIHYTGAYFGDIKQRVASTPGVVPRVTADAKIKNVMSHQIMASVSWAF